MNLLKKIVGKIRKFNQELNDDGITWIDFKRQWLEENNIKLK